MLLAIFIFERIGCVFKFMFRKKKECLNIEFIFDFFLQKSLNQ